MPPACHSTSPGTQANRAPGGTSGGPAGCAVAQDGWAFYIAWPLDQGEAWEALGRGRHRFLSGVVILCRHEAGAFPANMGM